MNPVANEPEKPDGGTPAEAAPPDITAFDSIAFIATSPSRPGVYRMLDANGLVLYVGKAKNLKKRVSSYFQKSGLSPRIAMMVSQIGRVEVTVTQSEGEALILENNLIKSLTPRYNILFRDDKSYPYLMLSGDDFPRMGFFRGALDKSHRYFGPFPHAGAVRESIQLLQRVFQLRTCEDAVFRNRSRPCLLHQIRRCSAPCVGLVTAAEYGEDVKNAALLLDGQGSDLVDRLTERMHEASEQLRFEAAAVYRDQVQALSQMLQKQVADTGMDVDVDVIAQAVEDGKSCVNLVMIRGGRQLGDRSFFPANTDGMGETEVLQAFIGQHYQDRPVPRLIVCPGIDEPEETASLLGNLAGYRVQMVSRPNGVRRVWAGMAEENARQALRARLTERSSHEARLANLRELLDLPDSARRIECFDISHTQGEATVASCVVFVDSEMSRSEYRRFNIEGVAPGDDYAALRQAVTRRYGKVAEGQGTAPDLVLIDGGVGQLAMAREALVELGLGEIPLASVSKGVTRKAGLEQIWIGEGRQVPLGSKNQAALHLIQEIRDEAHRFAITGHRARRSKKRVTSSLEQIDGIGALRRRELLARFGGLKGVLGASIDDLAQVRGVSRTLAERIYKELHAD
jgi:excinuclease ABC subunit C